jgi:hypothetical protein
MATSYLGKRAYGGNVTGQRRRSVGLLRTCAVPEREKDV